MRIVAIIGSPKGIKGNTGRLLEEVMTGIGEDAGLELIDLSELKVLGCTGCNACHRTGGCHLQDDFAMISEKLQTCDGFILASPNYIFSVTAQMKALFDRCGSIVHCLALEGKYGAIVETSGSGEDDEVIRYMERFINATGAQSVGGIGCSMIGSRHFSCEENIFTKARSLGKELCKAILDRKHFPDQAGYRGSFKARMKRLVEQRKNEWIFEYQYWQQHHHVEPVAK